MAIYSVTYFHIMFIFERIYTKKIYIYIYIYKLCLSKTNTIYTIIIHKNESKITPSRFLDKSFGDKFAQKRLFLIENRKREHYHWILHWNSLPTKFDLNWKFWFLDKLSEKEYVHSVLHIQNCVGTKFQLKLTVFWNIFRTKKR